jgi:hypothetical protein
MGTPFSFNGALNLPGDPSLPPEPIPFNLSAAFESEVKNRLVLTGSGTKVVSLGTITSSGAKFIGIKVDTGQGAQAILVQFNGGGAPGELEISPGGFIIIANPSPQAGVTELSIVYTSNVTVNIWALG